MITAAFRCGIENTPVNIYRLLIVAESHIGFCLENPHMQRLQAESVSGPCKGFGQIQCLESLHIIAESKV